MLAAIRSSASSSRSLLFEVDSSGALDSVSAVCRSLPGTWRDDVCESVHPEPKSENSWGEAVELFT